MIPPEVPQTPPNPSLTPDHRIEVARDILTRGTALAPEETMHLLGLLALLHRLLNERALLERAFQFLGCPVCKGKPAPDGCVFCGGTGRARDWHRRLQEDPRLADRIPKS